MTRFGPRFYGTLIWVGLATFVVHEAAHWAAGELLGYPMRPGLNSGVPLRPTTVRDAMLISAAGPAVTILIALAAFRRVLATGSTTAFAFVIWAAFMRLVAAGLGFVMPNDEARISAGLGLGAWTLPLLVSAGLVALAWIAGRRVRVTWRTGLLCYLVLSLVATGIVGLDRVIVSHTVT